MFCPPGYPTRVLIKVISATAARRQPEEQPACRELLWLGCRRP
jgi:hypothetical protein